MAHCRRCGVEIHTIGKRICRTCMRKWIDRRLIAFNQAESELGEMAAVNLEAIKKRVKQLERQYEKDEVTHEQSNERNRLGKESWRDHGVDMESLHRMPKSHS